MKLGTVIREIGGVALPKGLSLSEEVGNNGFNIVTVVSSGSVVVHKDRLLGEVYSYGVQKKPAKARAQAKTPRAQAKASRGS